MPKYDTKVRGYVTELKGDLALRGSPFGVMPLMTYWAFGCFVSEAAPELEVPFFFFSLTSGLIHTNW